MSENKEPVLSKELLEQISKVTAQRPKTILDHLVKHGSINSEEISTLYGYTHAPRAIRDVREQGIPLDMTRVMVNNKSIGSYTFGDLSKIEHNKLGGRQVFSKKFKEDLLEKYSSRCSITLEFYEPKYLQIDHRVPYEVAGEGSGDERSPGHFMLLCAAAQRQKSWECEHCFNLLKEKNIAICHTCYWAYPENYQHVAGRYEKRIDLVFQEEELTILESIENSASSEGLSLKQYLLNHHGS